MGHATRPRPTVDRGHDRTITIAGAALAGLFLAAAVVALVVPGVAAGPWLAIHLTLAGGAGVAIAAVLPFFAATLVAAPPASAGSRLAAVALVAVGASILVVGVHGGSRALGAAGGAVYLAGMIVLLGLTLRLLRRSLGARRRLFTILYVAALGSVLIGAALSTLMLAGVPAIMESWGRLRVAHAWANLFGFVGLVLAATLLHFYPTVVGARIVSERPMVAGLVALAAGPALVTTGFILGWWPPATAGAILTTAGAILLAAHAIDVLRRRARWSGDPGWHRFTTGSLTAAVAWLVGACLAASAMVLARGTGPGGWIGGAIAVPLVLGAVAQAIVGSWSHLVPAIGPGGPVRHAWQRGVLGRWASARLALYQVGVVALVITAVTGVRGPMETTGAGLVALSTLGSVALLAVALAGHRGPAAGVPDRA